MISVKHLSGVGDERARMRVQRVVRNILLSNALFVAALRLASAVHAAPVEEIVRVPVSVHTSSGPLVQTIVVTVFRDDQRGKSPYLIINHGRSGDPDKRATFGRARFPEISRQFVALGFTVLVPTRIGYGVSQGPDVESPGPSCDNRNYAPGFDTAAEEIGAVLRSGEAIVHADTSRGLVVGTSFGGMLSIKLATNGLPGLAGVVNFAGGMGGNPTQWPEHPCAAAQIDQLYRGYGARARVPSLWLYSSNDRYWGPLLPRQWYADFVHAGGTAEFVQLPPFAEDGHMSFNGNPDAWSPAFQQFVRKLGLID
ncbi:exported hypothetical protein [Bradyrhizobium sp. STM 3809]|nr:exported hypothetical protein [Bradyrhizobium sp. STM 3809]